MASQAKIETRSKPLTEAGGLTAENLTLTLNELRGKNAFEKLGFSPSDFDGLNEGDIRSKVSSAFRKVAIQYNVESFRNAFKFANDDQEPPENLTKLCEEIYKEYSGAKSTLETDCDRIRAQDEWRRSQFNNTSHASSATSSGSQQAGGGGGSIFDVFFTGFGGNGSGQGPNSAEGKARAAQHKTLVEFESNLKTAGSKPKSTLEEVKERLQI